MLEPGIVVRPLCSCIVWQPGRSAREIFLQNLCLFQSGISAIQLQELIPGSSFQDSFVLNQCDLVSVPDRGETMRNDQAGLTL